MPGPFPQIWLMMWVGASFSPGECIMMPYLNSGSDGLTVTPSPVALQDYG